jgi:3-methyladenine DNA glycosylase AlkD
VEGSQTLVKAAAQIDIVKLARAIVTRLESIGLARVNNVRAIRREFSSEIKPLSANQVIELALLLLNSNELSSRFVAYELVHYHVVALRSLNSRNIVMLGKGIDNWAAVDTFACYLSGPAWRERQIPDSVISSWTRSKDRWWRRAAVVSTVALNNKTRGGRGDTKRTIEICKLVVDDHDDMIVKALSWALRELSKREPKAVGTFISDYESCLHPRVLREVRTKLRTGLKNPKQTRGD